MTGTFRVKVSGDVQLWGGLKTFGAEVEVITYIEYEVNTQLRGVWAWTQNPQTGQTDLAAPQVLQAVRGCTAESCGVDTVTDTLRVMVKFKKIFLTEVGVQTSSAVTQVDIQARLASITEELYLGTVPFTHQWPHATQQ